jgi:RHS repeat-associated protein
VFKDAAGVVSKTIEYTYDGNNQRIGKRIDGVTTERYVIDRNQIALVFDGNGNQTHRYLYGTQIDQILADETSTRTLWALGDNQGTVRDLIDDGGNLVEHLTYDSFGKLSNASTTGFRYGYTGREQDSETGLDYYRARYYDAGVGRFIREDPIGFAAGDTNIYRYVGNSPTNGTDPSGLSPAALKDFLVSLGLRTLTLPFNKTTYTNGMPIGSPFGILGWRSIFQIADALSPTQHFTKFLDYYFADGSSRRTFVLEEQDILESIKSIPMIRTATNEFNQRMQRAINAKIRDLQNKSTCPINKTIVFKIDRDLFVNLTTNGNFALGQTKINAIGKVNMLKQGNGNVSVIDARIDYKLTDTFDDAVDTFNFTNPENAINIRGTDITVLSLKEELIGGVGYRIEGNWSTGIGNYRRN